MANIVERIYANQLLRIAALVAALLLVIFVGGVTSLNIQAKDNARNWLDHDFKRFTGSRQLVFSSGFANDDKILQQRLQEQLDNIRKRAKSHLEIMVYYYARYYMAITLAAFTGIVAAITMLLISKKGWDEASPYLVAVFLTMSGLAAYFAAFPTLFEQKANIDANKELFAVYANLEDRILTFAATKEDMDTQGKDLKVFIHEMDLALARNNKLPVELNPDGITEITDSLNKTFPPQGR